MDRDGPLEASIAGARAPASGGPAAVAARVREAGWPRERLALGGILLLAAALRLVRIETAGYGNPYYAAAVWSMLQGWHTFFFASFDPAGFVSVDKPPLGLWAQTASAKLLGFHGVSPLLPQVLAGLVSVVLLYHLVRRVFGPLAGLVAALVLALTPVSIVTDRTNELDSLVVLLVLLAAWAFSLAAERGRLGWLLAGAVLVGVGFNVKMLQAYLPLPAFYLVYLVGAPRGWAARLGHLALATAVLLAVSLAWAALVDLTPPDQRPYVGSSGDNRVLTLVVEHNGLNRLLPGRLFFGRGPRPGASTSGGPPPPAGPPGLQPGQLGGPPSPPGPPGFMGEIGERGPLRLFNRQLAGQASWLFPLALLGLLAAGRQAGRGWPLDRRGLALLLWGMWLLTEVVFFSVATLFHRYYLVMLAPPLAALVGAGLAALWRDYHRPGTWGWLLPAALLSTTALQALILVEFPEWSDRLAPVVVGLALLATAVLVDARIAGRAGRLVPAAAALGLLALLVAPTTWAAIAIWQADGFRQVLPFAGPPGGPGPFFPGPGAVPGPGSRPSGAPPPGPGPGRGPADPALVRYLQEQRGGAAFLVATPNTNLAAPIILATGQPAMALGGFSGRDPILTTEQLAARVARGEVRFFLLPRDVGPGPGRPVGPGAPPRSDYARWVAERCAVVPDAVWQSVPPAPPEPPAGAPPGPGPGFGLGLRLYDCGAPGPR